MLHGVQVVRLVPHVRKKENAKELNKMTIKEYTEQIAKEFSKRIDRPVVTTERKKNNGVIFYGLQVIETDTINSIFYINNLYQGKLEVDEALENLCMWFEELKGERLRSYQWLKNFDLVKGNLSYKLVNKEENEFMMQDYVCEEFLDLLKIYIININDLPENIQRGSIMIEKRLLAIWDIAEEEVKELAEKNADIVSTCVISKMGDVMKRIFESTGNKLTEEMEKEYADSKMWVMTNEYTSYGAACMCYKDKLKEFADSKEDNIYIIPSSIHEVILLLAEDNSVEYLKDLLKDVNKTTVSEEEILSSNLYMYNRQTEQIEIV